MLVKSWLKRLQVRLNYGIVSPMNIKDIKKGDTVKLIADRNTIDTTYTGIAYTDYKATSGNPGVSLTMIPSGKMYHLTDSKHGLRLTSWRGCSLLNVAQYGYFI